MNPRNILVKVRSCLRIIPLIVIALSFSAIGYSAINTSISVAANAVVQMVAASEVGYESEYTDKTNVQDSLDELYDLLSE